LILRLCQFNVNFRYTANTALQHPWITKKVNAPIPLTIYESYIRKDTTENLSKITRVLFFLAVTNDRNVTLK